MTLDEIDIALLAWAERLRLIDDNLLALEADSTYQVLKGEAGRPSDLTGVTAARVKPALDSLTELFESRGKLTDVLDRARAIRASISGLSFWENAEKEAQIERLLFRRSIHLRTTTRPLAARALLANAEQDESVSPEELVTMMVRAFELARDAVISVSQAWSALEPDFARIEAELAHLRAAAESLSENAALTALSPIEGEIKALRSGFASDPLGVFGNVGTSILPRIAAVRANVLAQLAAFERVSAALSQIDVLRAELVTQNARAKDAHTRATKELSPRPVLQAPLRGEEIDGIDAWTSKLRSTVKEGRFGPAEIGAGRLRETLSAYIAKDAAIVATLDVLLAERGELAGRVSARRAQLNALASRSGTGARDVEAEIHRLAEETEEALRARPTDLTRARKLANAFEKAVSDIAARARR